tara:strand:- start:662 stop:772 length:111 start_codon:yes stop_codon:yes gene_type:complete
MAHTWNDYWDGDKRIGPRLPHGGFTKEEEQELMETK